MAHVTLGWKPLPVDSQMPRCHLDVGNPCGLVCPYLLERALNYLGRMA